MENDIIIVGAGISGAVLAERYASVMKKKVLVVEKRGHLGGNCYDFTDKAGILVPKYGPHFFHTNYEDVWKYVQRFTDWTGYEHRVLSRVDGKLVPVPVNIKTVNIVFGLNLRTEAEMNEWLGKNVDKIKLPKNSEDSALSRVGRVLYEKMFKNYTKKQWDMWPSELDASVMDRIPVRTTEDDRYFSDKYQAVPKNGYASMFRNMFDSPNIKVMLNTDFFEIKHKITKYERLFYTGPIDQYFNYFEGHKLEYRSVRFEMETLDQEQYQPAAVVNYPNEYSFTRITEPKYTTGQKNPKTTIIREYPTWDGEPYYPVPTKKNQELYERYKKEAEKLEAQRIYFVGRLANYKYFNMDQAFKNALDLFKLLTTQ
jgi:UDP-galactopyranose mutase